MLGQASNDQKGRLLISTERHNQSTDRIKESRKTMLEKEDLGEFILRDLHQQRESLLHANKTGKQEDFVGHVKKDEQEQRIVGSSMTALLKKETQMHKSKHGSEVNPEAQAPTLLDLYCRW
ncbi:hypothetical protein JHK85_010747 [Glycine max]|nr:hypothetical protein JHK85_010747 [Glycine max]